MKKQDFFTGAVVGAGLALAAHLIHEHFTEARYEADEGGDWDDEEYEFEGDEDENGEEESIAEETGATAALYDLAFADGSTLVYRGHNPAAMALQNEIEEMADRISELEAELDGYTEGPDDDGEGEDATSSAAGETTKSGNDGTQQDATATEAETTSTATAEE